MFSSAPNYTKLKTNLRLALNRLKLLEKKKTELAQKARKEIADYLATGKIERARIRVEHIIREDYLVEAMEIIEMYCDLLLARFGLVTQMKELDEGIAEAVSSLVWVALRLQSDVAELKVISDIFIQKYGPQFAEQSRTATGDHQVSEKLMHKLQLQAPPKLLVEKYLIEIAKNYNIEYEPDPQVMKSDSKDEAPLQSLIDLSDRNNLGGSGQPPHIGFKQYPSIPPLPDMPELPSNKPFNYPPPYGGGGSAAACDGAAGGFKYNIFPTGPQPAASYSMEQKDSNTNFINKETAASTAPTAGARAASDPESPDESILRACASQDPPPRYSSINSYNLQNSSDNKPKPQPRSKFGPSPEPTAPPAYPELPKLPNVPTDLPDIPNDNDDTKPDNVGDEIDFDDLSRRFQNLKKHK